VSEYYLTSNEYIFSHIMA